MKLVITGEVGSDFIAEYPNIEATLREMALCEARHEGMSSPVMTRIKLWSFDEQAFDPDYGYLNAMQLRHFVVIVRNKTW